MGMQSRRLGMVGVFAIVITVFTGCGSGGGVDNSCLEDLRERRETAAVRAEKVIEQTTDRLARSRSRKEQRRAVDRLRHTGLELRRAWEATCQ